ncbi:MAG: sigma-54-dependent Fis family transcriptional regulator [Magnetococcales bacterium]|nr:sigma-54-dependent Fis family transcriptional regulator [Magnetococcales bacterium]
MNEKPKILLVDDEPIAVRNLTYVMRKEGYQVTSLEHSRTALSLLEKECFDVVLTDLRMDGADGMQILAKSREKCPDGEVIVITGFATLESAVIAMREGAFFYIAKPFRLEEVRKVVAEAVEKVRLRRENRILKEKLKHYQGDKEIITRDPAMGRLLETARQVAPSGCNILITGESGVGKELMARLVHRHGKNPQGPFLAVNCGVFNEDLLTNELFGHEKGAYTGAVSSKPGLLESAHGGVLFLDEITEMSMAMQVKLLRAVQEREFMRVGGTTAIPVDVQFIAATNRRILDAVQQGRFRQDLYYRLNVVTLEIPPLHQRRGDIALLADHFIKRASQRMGKEVISMQPDALKMVEAYAFPGNIRELENIMERAVALCDKDVITPQHLPDELKIKVFRPSPTTSNQRPTLEEVEKEYIQWVLSESNGNQTTASEILGIDRVSLWRKLKRLKIEENSQNS